MAATRTAHRRSGDAAPASRGFTVIEIIMVVILLVGASLMAAPLLGDLTQTEDLEQQGLLVQDALQEAQSAAMTGKGTGQAGVHFTSGAFTYFEGGTFTSGDPGNLEHELSDFVGITGVSLSDSGTDVVFEDHRGTPTQTGTVTLTDVGGNSRVITIGPTGVIEVD